MDEEPNPIKDILYEIINELVERNIQQNFVKGNSSEIIMRIISDSQNKIKELGGELDTNTAKLLTSLLHYLLSLALIPSQRKVMINNVDIDIVIPDLKTLETKPSESILICIPEIHDLDLETQIENMEKIQTNKENVWYVTEKQITKKTYSIENETIGKIIDDIKKFLSTKKTTQFRFFKAN